MPETKQGPASAAPAPEPLSAILAEMRAARNAVSDMTLVPTEWLTQWADRIEAAANREREINQKILAAANDANAILKDDRDRAIQFANAAPHPGSVSWKEMHEVYAKARAILSAVPNEGNAAAMRDALENFCAITESDVQELVRLSRRLIDEDIYGGGIIQKLVSDIGKARAALAAPARNCDRFKDAAEAHIAFQRFCRTNYNAAYAARGLDGCDDCELCETKNMSGEDSCPFHWLLATAEGGDHA